MKSASGKTILVILVALLIGLGGAASSFGQPVTRTIRLTPGWNAVFLEVDPASPDCEDVFAGMAGLLSVWAWDPGAAAAEFIQDPSTLVPSQPQWRVYLPRNTDLSTLHRIDGDRSYLIRLEGADAVDWMVTGVPTLPRPRWKNDSFNLVGFHLEPGNEPFFGDFFSSSPAHVGQTIFYLSDIGKWETVTAPETTRMKAGEAFWVYCHGQSDFAGPLSLELGGKESLEYGTILSEHSIGLRNLSADTVTVTLVKSGNAPLFLGSIDPPEGLKSWKDLPGTVSLPAGGYETVQLGTRRSGLVPGQKYEANLTITNGSGMRLIVPASVEGVSHAGLWMGTASINRVSEPRVAPTQAFPLASNYQSASEFSFRLILHVDESGQVRLLKQVVQMWDAAAGRYVLFSDDALIQRYEGGDAGPGNLTRRISSAAFGILSQTEPRFEALMTGGFYEYSVGGSLTCTVDTAPDDPLNPFRHQYHPDHKEAGQSYGVNRGIEMIFSDTDADGNAIPFSTGLGWGGADMGGIYRETIAGLHKEAIKVEGIFLLQRISDISRLEYQ